MVLLVLNCIVWGGEGRQKLLIIWVFFSAEVNNENEIRFIDLNENETRFIEL